MARFIKLYDKLLDNPIVCKDGDHLAIWVYLLLKATSKPYDVTFAGKRVTLEPGQLVTGRKTIASDLTINEYKVQRVLKLFENEHQIAQQMSSANRLVSLLKWSEYQTNAQPDEHRVHNERTASAQRLHTNKKDKKERRKEENTRAGSSPDDNELPPWLDDDPVRSFGEDGNVKLTKGQHEKLVAKLGEAMTETLIVDLSLYMKSKGATYKDHYATILSWSRKERRSRPAEPEVKLNLYEEG